MSTDVVISFDTTGSMSPCIAEVRRRVREALERLFSTIPDLRVGIISHGDYCDDDQMIDVISLTDSKQALITFVNETPNTSGGDSDEFYEYVLHRAQEFEWKADNKIFIMIGDAEPHNVGYSYYGTRYLLDWKEEAYKLSKLGVNIYAVQALGRRSSNHFYEGIAKYGNGKKLDLNQFTDAVETIIAICYHKVEGRLEEYKVELESTFKMNRNLASLFKTLGTEVETEVFTKTDSSGLIPVDPARFQIVHVDHDCVIKPFVESIGARFRPGRGFYQFTKSELVQEHKEVVLRNKVTGDMFTGSEARNFIGLPFGYKGTVRPKLFDDYEVYIQSTSYNRKLKGKTKFLYENEV